MLYLATYYAYTTTEKTFMKDRNDDRVEKKK